MWRSLRGTSITLTSCLDLLRWFYSISLGKNLPISGPGKYWLWVLLNEGLGGVNYFIYTCCLVGCLVLFKTSTETFSPRWKVLDLWSCPKTFMEILGPWFTTEYTHWNSFNLYGCHFPVIHEESSISCLFLLFLILKFSSVTLNLMSNFYWVYIDPIIALIFVLSVNGFGDLDLILLVSSWGWWPYLRITMKNLSEDPSVWPKCLCGCFGTGPNIKDFSAWTKYLPGHFVHDQMSANQLFHFPSIFCLGFVTPNFVSGVSESQTFCHFSS